MPWNRRMFWKVRATRASQRDLVAGHALEQIELARVGLACRPGERVSASTSAAAATPCAGERKAPLGRLVEAGDAIEDRRLARAVRADQRGDVAAADLRRRDR